jgi:site-specific recombinase XerD
LLLQRSIVEFLEQKRVKKAAEITESHVHAYQQHLIESLEPLTVGNRLYAASGLLSFAVRQG